MNKETESQNNLFVKLLESREQSLNESLSRNRELALKNIDGKRALLISLVTVSAGITAGLFLILATHDVQPNTHIFAVWGGCFFIFFILISTIYLATLLSYESIQIDQRMDFGKSSLDEFVNEVGNSIVDFKTYEKYRLRKSKEEQEKFFKKELFFTQELYFWIVVGTFIIPLTLILIAFLAQFMPWLPSSAILQP